MHALQTERPVYINLHYSDIMSTKSAMYLRKFTSRRKYDMQRPHKQAKNSLRVYVNGKRYVARETYTLQLLHLLFLTDQHQIYSGKRSPSLDSDRFRTKYASLTRSPGVLIPVLAAVLPLALVTGSNSVKVSISSEAETSPSVVAFEDFLVRNEEPPLPSNWSSSAS